MTKGKVYIIGAGCGNIDLLTLKGKRIIEEADTIVYDRLIDPRVLALGKKDAELIYLGKGNTEGGLIQETINKTLAEKALEGKVVARVKGGDPFVFGRGGEEIEEIIKYDIPFEIIPGISSSIAVPEYAGIPVTHRGVSRSFHVFTGHTMENGQWHDFSVISKLKGTLVFLMGIKNLDLITGDLIKYGKNPKTPIAIIEKGTTPDQRVTTGTLENIVEIAKERKIVPPAITIIGDVVNLRDDFAWFENLNLNRKKILVTRDKHQAPHFTNKLLKMGAGVEELPLLEIIPEKVDFTTIDFSKYKAILFNSPNGVKTFMDNIEDLRVLGNIKIGVVGSKTEEVLREYKLKGDFIPEKYMVSELAKMVPDFTNIGDEILVVTSNISPCDCEGWEKLYNRKFTKLVTYSTNKVKRDKKEMEDILNKIEYITILSSSTGEALFEAIEGDLSLLDNKKVISIGPMTSETLNKLNIPVYLEAKVYDTDGIIEVISNDK